jgi:hypothetical protein
MSSYILYTNTNTNSCSEQDNGNKDNKDKYSLKEVDPRLFNKLLYNQVHKKLKFTKSKEIVEKKLNIKLESDSESELINIIPMIELSETQLNLYLDCYTNENDNLDKFAELLSIIKYEQVSPNNFQVNKRLESLLTTQSYFWEDPSNCRYSLNNKFKERRFNNIDFSSVFNIPDNVVESLTQSENSNYLHDIIRNTNWVDMNVKSSYFISANCSMSPTHVTQIYMEIPTEYLKYIFLCNLLITRTHCHLVINNKKLLELAKPILDKFTIVFKYLIGYAWLALRNEESIIKTRIRDTDRFVFDLETVNNLPIYPFSHQDINLNPYSCVLLDNKLIDLPNNCMSMDMMKEYTKYYGLSSLDEFKRRLNIFVNKQNIPGILDSIDWEHCVITGSAMTACGMKYNPLMDVCKSTLNGPQTDSDLSLYFQNYYADSDIDLLCNHKSVYDFIDCVEKFTTQVKNISGDFKKDIVHTGTIIISDEFIMYELDNLKKIFSNKQIDVNFVKKNFNDLILKSYFYDKYYVPWKNDQEKLIKEKGKESNIFYQDLSTRISKEEFRIYTLDYTIDEQDNTIQDYEKYIYSKDINSDLEKPNKLVAKLSESIRFKISSNKIRTFEIFKSRDSSFFSIVSRFHMGFVRAYYNGTTLKCLPSYITSMMLQLTTDYKYFSSIRDPIEIVNKYRSRGFGIILNDHEKLHMVYFNGTQKPDKENKWADMYGINIKIKSSRDSVFGTKPSSSEIFKPGKYFSNLPHECFRNPFHITITDKSMAFDTLKNGKLDEFIKLKSINDKGFIQPFDPTIIKIAWNKMTQTNE